MVRTRRIGYLAVPLLLAACGEGPVAPPPACNVDVQLQPGQMLASDPTTTDLGCGFRFTGPAGARYRVAVLRPDSAAPSATSQVVLRIVAPTAAPAPAPASALRASLPSTFQSDAGSSAAGDSFHEALRRSEGALVASLGTTALLPSRMMRGASAPARVAPPSPNRIEFDPGTSCTATRTPRTAFLLGENDVMAVYQDSVEHQVVANRIRADLVQRLLSFYGDYGKRTVETYFGTLPDIDGNGRVTVVITGQPFPNADVVAYVWAGNYYARSACPASDESEIIFLNPMRVRSMDRGEFVALGVLSHESHHLVSLYHRLARTRRRNSGTFLGHPVWIEEGRAEIADELTSRVAWSQVPGGPSRTEAVNGADLDQGIRSHRAESYGVALEASRTLWYLSGQPNGLAVIPTGAGTLADVRNGGWHFHRWLGDAYGFASRSPGADATLFRNLTDSLTASGGDGFVDVLGKGQDELVEQFIGAVMLHGSGTSQVSGFTTYDFVSLTSALFTGTSQPPGRYPWPVTTSGSGSAASLTRPLEPATYSGMLGPTGVRIYDFTASSAASALLTLESDARLRVVIARLQ